MSAQTERAPGQALLFRPKEQESSPGSDSSSRGLQVPKALKEILPSRRKCCGPKRVSENPCRILLFLFPPTWPQMWVQ